MNVFGLVVAAGSGQRAGIDPPKQYARLGGCTVLARTLNEFLRHPQIAGCLAVIAKQHRELFRQLVEPELAGHVTIVSGGETRAESVFNGIEALAPSAPTHVLIHDGARPFVPAELITRVIRTLEECDATVPVQPVADALWSQEGGRLTGPVNRSDKCRAQTPQGFAFEAIRRAYCRFDGPADDDASVALAAGIVPRTIAGSAQNMKITFAEDLALGERMIMASRTTRSGYGFDVHRFAAGNSVILCGVKIPFDRSLAGHSDADVAAHAIADAIYGAIADGDIGRWFPPDDPKWQGVDSRVFLRHAAGRATLKGFRIAGIDCTIVCEAPKIAPHAGAMREQMAACLEIPVGWVGVKATTSEGLGFTGRGEGIVAHALATLIET